MRRLAPLLPLAMLLIAGCVTEDRFETATASAVDGNAVVIEMDDMLYRPDRLEVPAGEPVTIVLENHGGIVHDLVFEDGWASGEVPPGQAATVAFGPFVTGTVGWCSVPGHRDAGMELEIVVVPGS